MSPNTAKKTLTHDVPLTQLRLAPAAEEPLSPAADRQPLPLPMDVQRPDWAADVSGILDGEPFHPFKALNHFDRLRAVADGANPMPVTVEIDPSNVCNHRCGWCVSMMAHTGEMMRFERFEELVEELKRLDVRSVVLKGGGEPTVHPRFVDMLEKLHGLGLGVGLITNGSMPRKGSIEAVLACADWVRFSVDAADAATHEAIHGTKDFEKVIGNIEQMARRTTRTLLGMNFVAEGRNHRQIAPFAALGKSLGVAYVSIRCVFDPANPLSDEARAAMRQGAAAAKQYEDARFRVFTGNFTDAYLDADAGKPFPYDKCLGPNMVGVVGAEGEVYACCFLRGDKRFSFGNVNERSFADIWNGDRRQDVMQAVYRGECGYACKGGMTANRYNIYNQILNYMRLENKAHAEFV